MNKQLLIVFITLFAICSSTFSLYADTNGIWNLARDVRPGTFGSDEISGTYVFDDEVDFNDIVSLNYLTYYQGDELDVRFVNENQLNSITSSMIADGTIQGEDLEHSYRVGSVYDSRFVNENQLNSITSSMIVDGTIQGEDLEHSFKIGSAYDYRFVNVNQVNSITSSMVVDGTIQGVDLENSYRIGSVYDSRFVNQAGDSMSGVLNMGGNKITNVGTPTSDTDVTSKVYVDNKINNLNIGGSISYVNCQPVDCWYNDVVDRRTHPNYCSGDKIVRGLHATDSTCWMECCDIVVS